MVHSRPLRDSSLKHRARELSRRLRPALGTSPQHLYVLPLSARILPCRRALVVSDAEAEHRYLALAPSSTGQESRGSIRLMRGVHFPNDFFSFLCAKVAWGHPHLPSNMHIFAESSPGGKCSSRVDSPSQRVGCYRTTV